MKYSYQKNTFSICRISLFIFSLVLLQACNNSTETNNSSESPLFSLLEADESGIHFNNVLQESPSVNTYVYFNAYNGGGVAIGDINNDNLPDIYFTGSMVENKLYLNKGNMQFEDITSNAGVGGRNDWTTGVTMADVNNDGLLDIYVCRAYNNNFPELAANLLYINNGDLTFTEQAQAYGIADQSWSTHSTFFDYDLDGDLDLYVLNHLKVNTLDHGFSLANFTNPVHERSDHFYRNNGNGTFTDVTVEAGVLNYGVGLGVVSGDVNNDGWPDIYVANDRQEPDILYINNGDGTFENTIHQAVRHTSYSSMGVDLSDFNNDGQLDMMVCDMMAQNNYRRKTQMFGMNPQDFWMIVADGYHYQYMRNVLQLNNGNGTFSEIGQMAGVAKTDWSWATFFADFDNDGLKDLFVSNGIKRDIEDNDFKIELEKKLKDGYYEGSIEELVNMMPSNPIPNKIFRNNGDLTFSDKSSDFGITQPCFSNGAAYADLDLDGDLDLVVNNINLTASVYENNARKDLANNYLQIQLSGENGNLFALGAKVSVKSGDLQQHQELTLTRGFKSSVEPKIHFGLGSHSQVDEVVVTWPDGTQSRLNDIAANQLLEIDKTGAKEGLPDPWGNKHTPLFTDISKTSNADFQHSENEYDDYLKESLLPHKTSQFGPKIALGDVDGNGWDDFFIGGASGQAGVLYLQNDESDFRESSGPWQRDRAYEDIGALFFDADNDEDLDLYVVSGGNEFEQDSPLLQDRLYVNLGNGQFERATDALPEMLTSGGCVSAADYDGDGDLDLFIGGRLIPGQYPFAPRSYLLQNDNGKFTDVTAETGNDLLSPGLVTTALWTDFDKDEDLDLILTGEWMPISFFENNNGNFTNQTEKYGFDHTTGWWNIIIEEDFDGDGDMDYVAGNLGKNYKYKASDYEPLHIYCSDFDKTGTYDIVLGYYDDGTLFPVRGRQCSSEQMPFLKEKFPTYDQFAKANINDIYGDEALESALHYQAKLFTSSYIENQGNGTYSIRPLPIQAQIAPVQGLISRDFNSDGNMDILLSGNFHVSEMETGRADAGNGLLLLGDGKGNFQPTKISESGFYAPGDVRDMVLLNSDSEGSPLIIVANNNDRIQVIKHEEGGVQLEN
ncbi:MAG: hypothetical protein DWQ02_26995 [Bacteroidetes bacterium]|nr:MAG: hypothetical protein DWQ02_26995 [Bacteroidota bacterium]